MQKASQKQPIFFTAGILTCQNKKTQVLLITLFIAHSPLGFSSLYLNGTELLLKGQGLI